MSDKITALSFDATNIEPQKPIEVIPAGWYNCEISDAEVKATRGKSGGTRANFELTVTTGDYKGRKFFAGINVKNANAQAQEIGQRELSAICHSVGIVNVSDLRAFVGKQLQVKVKVRKASEEDKEKGYEDRNEPSGFKALDGAAVSGPAFVPGAPPPAPPAAPAAVATFPPAGWVAHPTAPGHFYCGQEVKTEAELRAMFAPPAAPVAPPAPPAPAAPPAAPTPPPAPVAPVVAFPPAGWLAHPTAPGWFYNSANTAELKDEATLRAMVPAPPAAPAGPPMPPAPAAGSPPPWKTPAA